MSIKDELRDAREKLGLLSLYQRFEHIVVVVLTALIAVIVVAAVWSLSLQTIQEIASGDGRASRHRGTDPLSTMLSMRETSAASLRSLLISAVIACRSMPSTTSPMCSARARQASATDGMWTAASSR
jgi:hypothetical protein